MLLSPPVYAQPVIWPLKAFPVIPPASLEFVPSADMAADAAVQFVIEAKFNSPAMPPASLMANSPDADIFSEDAVQLSTTVLLPA